MLLALCCLMAAGGCEQKSPDGSSLLSLLMNNSTGDESSGLSTNSNGEDGATVSPDNPLIRMTRFGSVEGTEEKSDTWVWRGIPYAKPPVGDLRWRSPRDPEPWTGVRGAREFCSYCTQYGNFITDTGRESLGKTWGDGRMVGSEDCLYLNIWRPRTAEKKLPVYVFIYGGGNILGRSDLTIYNGANFSKKQNMVVVNFNYRLGYFGWFHHSALEAGDPAEDSGNFGTLDIIKALSWIKNNITAFGGDPDNVTISGQSAGAFNIISLLTSPLAKGLFHKAVMHSGWDGSCNMLTANMFSSNVLSRLLVQDKYALTIFDAAAFLSNKKKELGEAGYKNWVRDYLRSKRPEEFYPSYNCGPIATPIDGFLTAGAIMGNYEDGYVIPGNPYVNFFQGKYHRVPLLFGCMSEELKLFLPFVLAEDGQKFYDTAYNFNPDNPIVDVNSALGVLAPLRFAVYALAVPIGQVVFQGFGVDTMARAFTGYQDNVYVYKFLWNDEPAPFDFLIGAAHAMDLPFAFGNFPKDRDGMTHFAWSAANESGRLKLSNAYMTYLGQFARTGNPNGADPGLPEWKPFTKGKDMPKRMLLDSGRMEMSTEVIEEAELAGMNATLADIWQLVMKTFNLYN
jgi:para-nitrobenzyl esterase